MMLVMVSMIGVSPLAGFYAKWWVLAALLDAGQLWLAIAGVPPFAGFWSKDEILAFAFDDSPALWVVGLITALQQAIVDVAEREVETIMPGFTHLQPAQPVTFGHHMMAWFEMLERNGVRG